MIIQKASFVSFFLCMSLLILGVSFADELSQSEVQLQQVTEQLTQLQKTLAASEKEASAQQRALRSVESELGQVQRDVSQLTVQLAEHQKNLETFRADEVQLKSRLAGKESEIQELLRLAYKQNNQPLIKLLLSGERPEALSRHLYYFSRLTETQQATLSQWIEDQQKLADTITAEQQTVRVIEEKQNKLTERQRELVTQKNRRAQVVADLSNQAKDTKAEIERKKSEREKLGQLIEDIKAELASFSLDFPSATEIAKVKGQLEWPVDGKLLNGYGRSINGSALNWQGWLIAAADGAPVRAVHGGRILFADFFKSNGLLIILDHGDGVWTLYGRNQTLLRDVGSWVNAGDVIAEVGRSGGYSESGLYFEVRHQGQPQNPSSWLRKR